MKVVGSAPGFFVLGRGRGRGVARLETPRRSEHRPWLRIERAIRAVLADRLTRGATEAVDRVLMARIREREQIDARRGSTDRNPAEDRGCSVGCVVWCLVRRLPC